MRINWKQKLSSRKLWTSLAGWMTAVLTSFGVGDHAVARVLLLVSGIGSLTVYALAESAADRARAQGTASVEAFWRQLAGADFGQNEGEE